MSAGFDLVSQRCGIAFLKTPLMGSPSIFRGIIRRDHVTHKLLDRGPVSVACDRDGQMFDELFAVGVVAPTERAGVRPDHRLAQRVMEHGQQKGVAHGRPWARPDHVVRTIAATCDGDVVFVVGVARLKRQDRQDDLRAVKFRQALGTAELIKLLGAIGPAHDVPPFQFRASR